MSDVDVGKLIADGGLRAGLLVALFVFGPKVGAFLKEIFTAFREDLKAERQSRMTFVDELSKTLEGVNQELQTQTHVLTELRRDIRQKWSGDIDPDPRR